MFSRNLDRALRASEERFEAFTREEREDRKRFEKELESDRRRFEREMEQRYRDELQVTREFMRRNEVAFGEVFRVLADLVEESKAQRRALFQILDRLENGGEATA